MSSSRESRSRKKGKKIVTKDGKVLLQVLIPKELYEELVRIAPTLYGSTRGALSYVVTEALKHYLAPRLHATHANPPRNLWMKFKRVKKALTEILNIPEDELKECTEKQLEIAISCSIGSDPRTINKYKDLFEKVGLIKNMAPEAPKGKRVFEILG